MRQPTATPAPDPRGSLPRAELAALAFLARYEAATLDNYRSCLRNFFAWCASHDLDPLDAERAHLELWVRHLSTERRNKPATIHHKIGIISGFYQFATIDQYITTSPAAHVRRPRVFVDHTAKVGLTRDELGALIHAGTAGRPSEGALIALLGMLGLRISEACAVQIEDYGDDVRGHRVLRVVGKGKKPATIPLPVQVSRLLDRARGDRTSGPLLIRETNGQPMNRAAAHRILRRLAKKCGIKVDVHPHLLRHAFVTACLDANVPLRDVQIAARHEDPRTTMRYDRARGNLDRHAAYIVAGFLAGAA